MAATGTAAGPATGPGTTSATGRGVRGGRWATALAGAVALLALSGTVVLELLTPASSVPAGVGVESQWSSIPVALALLVPGLLLLARMPRHPVAALLAGPACSGRWTPSPPRGPAGHCSSPRTPPCR